MPDISINNSLLKIQVDAGQIERKVVEHLLPNRIWGSYELLKTSQIVLDHSENCCSCMCNGCNCKEIKRNNIDNDVNYWLRKNNLLCLTDFKNTKIYLNIERNNWLNLITFLSYKDNYVKVKIFYV